jgi:tight adherence protein C
MIGLLLLGLLLFGAAAALAVRAVAMSRVGAAGRLERINAYGIDRAGEHEGVRPSLRGAVAALAERVGRAASRFVDVDEAPRRAELMSAGLYSTTPLAFLGYRVLAAVFPPLFLVFVAAASGSSPLLVVFMAVFSAVFGWLGPRLIVRRLAQRRQTAIEVALPELIDLLVVTVEAGLAFSGSIQIAAERMRGPLGDELRLTLQEQRMGLSVNEALSNMLIRCDTQSMRSFVRSIIQGETLGVSIGTIMRNLAIEMRKRRRQAAEERAQKAPIKILFPLVFLIFPAMFIVLLYPAIHSFGEAFGGG